ncbi:serine hydrolase [Streptomyces cinnamoneus]|uniref:Serine hydrolase n=1 Tax=Streptomyces cinnamoneus TaxID=53446 RepID=A0A2G1XD58_STRCJ|nr:serine hydrolase domain-containing protein [Streptomyces cinnamoneus]PHQ49158.1 serine hydrolase [Streptomyces cinnamoneus]PPT15192.1 serine hydrolase [Streptomyces cinnamoneus]
MRVHVRRTGRWARAGRTGAVALAVAVMATGVAEARQAGAAGSGGRGSAVLDKDVRAVRAAGGDVAVLAEVSAGREGARARTGPQVPWDAQFRAASTTKTFTAVVVLRLVADGKVSLDDTVEKWLPGVVSGNGNDGSKITVRDLLQQTSGLFDYVNDPDVVRAVTEDFDGHRYDTTPPEQWVAVAMRHQPLFTPDRNHPRWAYSNTNYLLAGMIAEKAAGVPWREQVESRIIAPLGLRHTSVPGANPFLPGPHAQAFLRTPDGGRLDVTEHSLQHTADSGVVSTTADLNTFFRALVTGGLLPKAQLAEMRRTVDRTGATDDLAQWPEGGYGLGLRWTPLSCGGGYWHHEGDGWGSYTRTGVTPDGRRAVAVSVTSQGDRPDPVALNKATRTLVDHALCAPAKS